MPVEPEEGAAQQRACPTEERVERYQDVVEYLAAREDRQHNG